MTITVGEFMIKWAKNTTKFGCIATVAIFVLLSLERIAELWPQILAGVAKLKAKIPILPPVVNAIIGITIFCVIGGYVYTVIDEAGAE